MHSGRRGETGVIIVEEQVSSYLNADRIRKMLCTDRWTIHYMESVDSTNNWARREAEEGAPEGSVYLADTQTAGKGSRGRTWGSPEGTSISMSLILRPEIALSRISMITLVMGLGAADGIRQVTGMDTGIKWPNDVVCRGRKLCGILTEMGPDGHYLVPGIGINVNVDHFSQDLADKATSVLLETGRKTDRDRIAAEILNTFGRYYDIFLETGDMTGLRERYQAVLANCGKRVRVLDRTAPYSGTALGIDRFGELLVKRDDTGATEKVFAGEVSVRGIYGYV
jgi:BirA family biotin operon repressor/biotin-[acetyl-CoA-carboxylase] ligase